MVVASSRPAATLILNPAAGRAGRLRAQLPAIESRLAAAGYAPTLQQTTAEPGSAARLARAAAEAGCALLLACGGDGTVHECVQGLAFSAVSLGVVPLGTADALARHLGLPRDPLQAVERLLTCQPAVLPLGVAETAAGQRFFTLMAGCGPDGALAASMPAGAKRRFGRPAYYGQAARLFASRRWPAFGVRWRAPDSDRWHESESVAMLAARVPSLGGLFAGLRTGASLSDRMLKVQLLSSPAGLSLPAWFALGRLGLHNPWLRVVDADELECYPLPAQRHRPTYAQADAESLGPLPLRLHVVPAALRLLVRPAL